jgi:hypothetical protein
MQTASPVQEEPISVDGAPALERETVLRVVATEAYEAISSLDEHSDLIRLILVETSLLAEKYQKVRRHDVPHIAEIAGLLNVLWQEVEATRHSSKGLLEER